jgi:nicotinate-nucleotide pyrophosphorylase (carboxylating)
MLEKLLEFLAEDVGEGDITTDATIPEDRTATAEVFANEDGVLAGLEEAVVLLGHFGLGHETGFSDGNVIKKGSRIIAISGNARKMLSCERTLLNVLMRMSGIATLVRGLRDVAGAYGVKIAGTRKTTPGFRAFEKKAIEIGGGWPHRSGLDDAFLIKDNHVAVAGLENAIKKVKEGGVSKTVEVEVSTTEDALTAARIGVDIIMLDNMTPVEVEKTINELKLEELRDGVRIELSGGITPPNLENFLKLGPDIISLGALTTGALWLDMNMRIKIADR